MLLRWIFRLSVGLFLSFWLTSPILGDSYLRSTAFSVGDSFVVMPTGFVGVGHLSPRVPFHSVVDTRFSNLVFFQNSVISPLNSEVVLDWSHSNIQRLQLLDDIPVTCSFVNPSTSAVLTLVVTFSDDMGRLSFSDELGFDFNLTRSGIVRFYYVGGRYYARHMSHFSTI